MYMYISPLVSFMQQCQELQSRRDLLTMVQGLLFLPITHYLDLEQTDSDLQYLQTIYSNYQEFLDFDERYMYVMCV